MVLKRKNFVYVNGKAWADKPKQMWELEHDEILNKKKEDLRSKGHWFKAAFARVTRDDIQKYENSHPMSYIARDFNKNVGQYNGLYKSVGINTNAFKPIKFKKTKKKDRKINK